MAGVAGPGLPRSNPRISNGTHNSGEEGKSERKEDEEGREEEDAEKRADELRGLIRQGKTISDDILELIKGIDEKEEKLSTARAVLNAKDLEDGKNLLLYAAAHGQVDSLTCLVRNMSERNNPLFPVLVKGLRASDVDGAPLLFHAAKSGNISCLKAVEEFISETLGPHELVEQLLTRDHISGTIIMYAAKSRNPKVFKYIQRLLNRKESKNYNYDYLAYDDKGRSLLHIAARSGGVKILKEVVGIYPDKDRLLKDLRHLDERGRTPLMFLLRNRSNAGFRTLQKMYQTLDEAGGGKGAARNQLTGTWRTPAEEEAPTALMHAARGGINSLRLVLNIFCPEKPEHEKSVNLDDILRGSSTASGMKLSKKRRGVLLAEAAGGGSVKVLKSVVSAIQTNLLKIKRDLEPRTETGKIREAIEAIQSYRDGARPAQNVFKYAISSGNPEAVKYIKDRVIETFSGKKDKVWKLLSGTDGGINCLTYAASVEDDQTKSYDESKRGDGDDKIEPTAESQEESGLGHGEGKTPEEEFHVEERRVKDNAAVFDEVLKAVDEAATQFGEEERVKLLESLFIATPKKDNLGGRCKGCIRTLKRNSRGCGDRDGGFDDAGDSDGSVNTLMPLAGAVFRSNEKMVERVYKAYRILSKENGNKAHGLNGWDVQKIMDQIPDSWTNPKEEDRLLYEIASSGGVSNVAPSMLGTIVKVLRWAYDDAFDIIESESNIPTHTLQEERFEERRGMRLWMERLIQAAAERGAFHAIRDLTHRTYFPFRSVMPPLLERIGDNEENTIEIVLHVISRARNPFHLGAVALRFISMAQIDYPMHEHSLSRLQGRIDRLMIEILRKLPKTVRSMGLEFGAHISKLHSKPFPKQEWKRLREADKLGFAVVQWMLEPSTVQDMVKDNHGSPEPEDSTTFLEQDPHRIDDPLQSALDRGSDALSFTNSPLVRDYMHSKFSKSVPSWASRAPFHHNIHEKFFKYGAEDKVNASGKKGPKTKDTIDAGKHPQPETAPAAQNVAQLEVIRETYEHEALQIDDATMVETAATQPGEVKGASEATEVGSVAQAETAPAIEHAAHGRERRNICEATKAGNLTEVETVPAAESAAHGGSMTGTDGTTEADDTQAEDSNEAEGTTQAKNTIYGGSEMDTKRHGFSNVLLRFFQGWDDDIERGPGILHPVSGVPHRTPMPALQFALAGIVGKPATFYEVPIVRFAFGIISHMAMLVLFCACVFLESEDRIPPNEIIFHVFIFGLLWRELLEIRELLPPRDQATIGTKRPYIIFQFAGIWCTGLNFKRRRTLPPNRVASALNRYFFHDSWNILDASTIICALTALIFRMAARFPGWVTNFLDSLHLAYSSNIMETSFFAAQWFFVISAPLLFARLLFLSQLDQTLGPMSQIIWTMLSHLARFSLFVMVIMFSFAIAFYVFVFNCYEGDDNVQEAYGTLERSMLSLFNAMLGDYDFDVLLDANNTCERPSWANAASACLLVVYLIIMAILLLNLLIAVLSTAHAEVEKNAKEEFHLARSRTIQQNWRIVLEDRLPSPMNLVKPILGTIVDFFYDLLWVLQWIWLSCSPYRNADGGKQLEYNPFSKGYWWKTAILGFLHRLIFACSMGLVALAASALLWIFSIPWMAWRYFRWCFQREKAWYHEGYFSSMITILLKVSCWLIFVFLAIVICAFSILGLIILWFRGVKQVFEWCESQCAIAKASERKHRPPERDWTYAWDVARGLNLGPTFDVRRLLWLTTGWKMKDVSAISKKVEAGRDEDLQTLHHEDVVGYLDQLTCIAKEIRDRVRPHQGAEKKDECAQVDHVNAPASGDATGESA